MCLYDVSFVFHMYYLIILVVNTSRIDCLERLFLKMTCYVLSGTLNSPHSLTSCRFCVTRFFNLMGTIFSFVTSDVNSKLSILQYHLASEAGDHYKTVEEMIQYEVANGITTESIKSGKQPSGSRTLLRLHRALQFLILLFCELAQSSESFSTVVGEAYNATLANHHPWVVRSAVSVALYAVPSRSSLIQRLDSEGSEERIADQLNAAVLAMQPVYDRIQTLYTDNDLLQLP